MLETSARLLQLLSLLQLRREWTGAALAERLSITERTVRRDIGKLRTLGYPISASPGIAGGYQLGAGAQLPPLLLDDDEALAVALGLAAVATGPVTGIGEASVRALAKLEQVLPGRLRPKFSALRESVSTLAGPPGGVDPVILTAFSAGITEHRVLSFRYTAADGGSGRRIVEPYRLVGTGRRWYAVAWDLDRSDWRTFRVDRCTSTPAPRERFAPRPLPARDLAAYVQESITRNPYRYTVVVRLAAPLAAVAERVPPDVASIEADGPGHTIVRGGWDSLDLPLINLTAWGVPFEILDPPEMRERARRAVALLQRAIEIPPTAESGKTVRPSH
ncbi:MULTISPECIES: YafY family protein [unclassified Arthrobacter]|uniref:helix-turn-helix transcriptional regulator n=1 Tax=unclassified Arthrobacter TaxID=235627 RepID=UPI001D15C297|nr:MULTISPECIES: WYL domain-containing protein [unclassified Arthrobacter]MCC3290539.1 WYL domain-containing protein [Arthrobacter sp. zg-Y1110]MCC3299948.1 WYL domain-containing protein [Arthrobacter sp. zg-Y895]UWX84100.1 WYL domain-containing protein [Arthrobacter sp. zg-Y1110]